MYKEMLKVFLFWLIWDDLDLRNTSLYYWMSCILDSIELHLVFS